MTSGANTNSSHSKLSSASFDATPAKRGEKPKSGTGFTTVVEGYRAAIQYNEDPEKMRCTHCDHQNERFPIEAWGWDAYAEQGDVAIDKRDATKNAAGGGTK